jgi:hypothetical protein
MLPTHIVVLPFNWTSHQTHIVQTSIWTHKHTLINYMILIINPNSSKRFVLLINIHFKKPNSCTSLCFKVFNNTIHMSHIIHYWLISFWILIISSSNIRTHGKHFATHKVIANSTKHKVLANLRNKTCIQII